MKYLNLSKQIAALAMVALVFTACDKVNVQKSIGDAGKTKLKIIGGATETAPTVVSYGIDFVNAPKTLLMADIRRDVANESDLNKTMTVVIKDDVAAIAAVDPTLVYLPAAWYTIASTGTPRTGGVGGVFTLTYAPGEFAKQISITIPNATVMDPSTKYALGFTITSADQNGVITEQRSVVVTVGAKNAYDGIYVVTGNFQHPTYGPGAGQPFGFASDGGLLEVALVTTGANTVSRLGVTPAGDIGDYDGFIFFLTAALGGPGYTGFSNVFPAYSVNPATNVVTVYALPGSANSVTWNNYTSTYNPGTKRFDMSFGYNGTRFMQETWIYARSR